MTRNKLRAQVRRFLAQELNARNARDDAQLSTLASEARVSLTLALLRERFKTNASADMTVAQVVDAVEGGYTWASGDARAFATRRP